MLTNHNHMTAYHAVIMGNVALFKDKVVMDVGTGYVILTVWAAQTGAKRVYATEYTDMARHAEEVVNANGVDDVQGVARGLCCPRVFGISLDSIWRMMMTNKSIQMTMPTMMLLVIMTAPSPQRRRRTNE